MHARTLTLLVSLTLIAPLEAADGDLVTTFGDQGLWVATEAATFNFSRGVDAPDGTVVVFGTRTVGGVGSFHWRRLDPSGVGALCAYTPPNSTQLRPAGAAFDSQGRLLLAGSRRVGTADPSILVMRFLYPACTFDPDFDGGVAAHAIGIAGSTLQKVAGALPVRWFVPPGTIFDRVLIPFVARNTSSAQDSTYIMRLTDDGLLDVGFGGGDGVVELAADRFATASAQTLDGRFLVAGVTTASPSGQSFVTKFDRDGVAVAGFGVAGERLIDVPGSSNDRLEGLAVGPDGRIATLGSAQLGVETGAVAVLTSGGALDPSFGTGGIATWAPPGSTGADFRGASFQGDRKLQLAGTTGDPVDGDDEAFVLRMSATGAPDPTFSGDGWALFEFDDVPFGEDLGQSLVANPDGRTWLIGSVQIDIGGGQSHYRPFAGFLDNGLIFADGFERGSTTAW